MGLIYIISIHLPSQSLPEPADFIDIQTGRLTKSEIFCVSRLSNKEVKPRRKDT